MSRLSRRVVGGGGSGGVSQAAVDASITAALESAIPALDSGDALVATGAAGQAGDGGVLPTTSGIVTQLGGLPGDLVTVESGDLVAKRHPTALCRGQLVDAQGVCRAVILDVLGVFTATETLVISSSAGVETYTAIATETADFHVKAESTVAAQASTLAAAINADSTLYGAAVVSGLDAYGVAGTAVVIWCLLAATTTLRLSGTVGTATTLCQVVAFGGGNYLPSVATRAALAASDPATQQGGIVVAAADLEGDWRDAALGAEWRYADDVWRAAYPGAWVALGVKTGPATPVQDLDFDVDLTPYASVFTGYRITGTHKNESGSTNGLGIRINGASGAGNRQYIQGAATSITTARDTGFNSSGALAAASCSFDFMCHDSRVNVSRKWHNEVAAGETTGITFWADKLYQATPASSVEFTRLGIVSTIAAAIGDETQMTLYGKLS